MIEYFNTFIKGYQNYASYLWRDITTPSLHSYFYALILISLFFFVLEWIKPWRKDQAKFRKDFWLDCFYMFFNFFLFSLVIYNAASDVFVNLFNDGIQTISGIDLQKLNPLRRLPMWAILIIGFVVRDFVQWWTHRLLHRIPFLWEYHKVHHSVQEMGFAAHLRYHWMETVVYRFIEYIPLALLGIGLYDFFVIHIFTIIVGHYNHSNISVSGHVTGALMGIVVSILILTHSFEIQLHFIDQLWEQLVLVIGMTSIGYFVLGSVMKRLFNHPEMHIWHHAMEIPEDRKHGVNFGISLAIWDFIFGTAYIPYEGRNIPLGFPDIDDFPTSFTGQITHGFK